MTLVFFFSVYVDPFDSGPIGLDWPFRGNFVSQYAYQPPPPCDVEESGQLVKDPSQASYIMTDINGDGKNDVITACVHQSYSCSYLFFDHLTVAGKNYAGWIGSPLLANLTGQAVPTKADTLQAGPK